MTLRTPGGNSALIRLLRWLTGRPDPGSQAALLWVLAIAAEKQLPLIDCIDGFAEESRGRWRHMLNDLAVMLQEGLTLPDALDSVPGIVPPEAIIAARIGAESGTLGSSLRAVAVEMTEGLEESPLDNPVGGLLYLFALVLVASFVVGFVMVFIIPKFKAIFNDFGVELPKMTETLIEISDGFGFLITVPILALIGAMLAVHVAHALGYMSDRFAWLTQIFPRTNFGGVLRLLGIVVDRGRPLPGAIETISNHHSDRAIHRRFANTLDAIEAGDDCWDSLYRQGLLRRRELAMIDSAARAGNLGWMLKNVGAEIDRQQYRRVRFFYGCFRPLVVLMFGFVVGFICIAMFLPLIKLMNDLS